ncbi:lipocalin-like domain-containing protein [Nioella sp.]|uniref:lipocalin-like domain-containing protein n=1 Tax=Nioella sp. TaxID=1912091 RepID=UPI003519D03B
MNVRVFLVLWLWATSAVAQGFAGLGTQAEGFAIPDPAYRIEFPQDHGPHPDYRIEWWYLTATLEGEDGQDYGVQWTLFRTAMQPGEAEGWDSPQIWMGHAAVTSSDEHLFAERLARGGIGQAGVISEPFQAFIDDWRMEGIDRMRVTARGAEFAYDLELVANGPLVLQGEGGYSVKSPDGQASHYYSQPFYRVSGVLDLPGGSVNVSGQGWLDREWSSQPLSEDQHGWDWFSLQFEDGARLMGFGLRDLETVFTSATWIDPDGATTAYTDGALRLTPLNRALVAGRNIPVEWRVELPARGVDVEVQALNPGAWMGVSFPYWEGPIRVRGSHQGRGYLEMPGY